MPCPPYCALRLFLQATRKAADGSLSCFYAPQGSHPEKPGSAELQLGILWNQLTEISLLFFASGSFFGTTILSTPLS